MTKIPVFDSKGSLTVKIEPQYACKAYLVDRINYQRFTSGQQFKGYGGYYNQTPITISINEPGRWYLIVIDGGNYNYSYY